MIVFLINLIVTWVILGLLYWAVTVAMSLFPVPPSAVKVVQVIFLLIFVLYLISVLTGHGPTWNLGL